MQEAWAKFVHVVKSRRGSNEDWALLSYGVFDSREEFEAFVGLRVKIVIDILKEFGTGGAKILATDFSAAVGCLENHMIHFAYLDAALKPSAYTTAWTKILENVVRGNEIRNDLAFPLHV